MDLIVLRKKLLSKLPPPLFKLLVMCVRFYDLRITLGPLTYNQDGLATRHNADFMKDPLFAEAYRLGKATGSWQHHTHWRTYVCCWAASMAARLEGDFVECGVDKGGYSRAVIHYVGFDRMPERKFWLLDTFSGLCSKYISGGEVRRGIRSGGYESCYAQVCDTFRPFSNVRVIQGAVPETLAHVKAQKVAYLSIDMNCVEPEIAAFEHFWDKLVPGAVVVLDDYGWSKHLEQKKAFDRIAKEKGVPVLCMPTGQGVIFKP